MEELEAEAKATASKHVMNLLQRPGQLEKVDQYKRRVSRKKSSVEALLKSAIQSQLDGVTEGLKLLQAAQADALSIKSELNWIRESISVVPEVTNSLQDVKENLRQSQYVTSIDSLKHIFSVPESVEKTRNWISDGKLLYARQSLADLENSRDDLLYELHKLPQSSKNDTVMLKLYFAEVENLSELMEKQIRLILNRTLNTVRKDPTVIVTALRIIESEEKADAFAIQRHKLTDFMPPGRPKKWKAMALSVLEKAVEQRIEGTQTDEREDNKMWLVRHLELTRQLILEDLNVVKTLCVRCFPPSWDIVGTYVKMYHQCLSTHLSDLVQNGLIGNEYVSLLSWCLHAYKELINELDVDISAHGHLLAPDVVDDLQNKYLQHIQGNYNDWMKKTLEKEIEDWSSIVEPNLGDGIFQSSAPLIIFQMIDQNLQVTRTISDDLTQKALDLSMEGMLRYAALYRDALLNFKTKHFADRNQIPFYTYHMITVINNCSVFRELAQPWRNDIKPDSFAKFEKLLEAYLEIRNNAVKYLLDEAFTDLYNHFNDLITPKWLTSTIPVDTICFTFEDYFQDYSHLREDNFEYVISVSQRKVARNYVYKIMQGKITFKNYEERKEATKKIKREIIQITGFFQKIAPNVKLDSCFEIVDPLVEIIGIEDPEMLLLDLHELVERYPDITELQLTTLLMTRGDLSRSEIRDKISSLTSSKSNHTRDGPIRSTIFSLIGKATSNMDWDSYWAN